MVDQRGKLSCYLLTLNSSRYLERIISPIRSTIDDLLVVDSGSSDTTEEIVKKLGGRFVYRRFDNFVKQRQFAIDQCKHKWVLCLDSDEIPDEQFAKALAELRESAFAMSGTEHDAYRIKRRWFVLGREVRVYYPISSPDYPVRLFNREVVGFENEIKNVHETIGGFESAAYMDGSVLHFSIESTEELYRKMVLYTTLAADDLRNKGKKSGWPAVIVHSIGAWLKWYIKKSGWKDGRVGFILGRYAFRYTFQKYYKLMKSRREQS